MCLVSVSLKTARLALEPHEYQMKGVLDVHHSLQTHPPLGTATADGLAVQS